jgi:HlyD family type I secretion membrane fusion protein
MSVAAPSWLGTGTIALFLIVFAAWSVFAPMSGAVIAPGNLQVEGQRQAVQHPYGGVVSELRVREGDHVSKGQILLVLSSTEPRAQLDILLAERDALLAEESRLIAERDKLPDPSFDSLRERRHQTTVAQAMANEVAIMQARSRQVATQTEIQRQRIAQLTEQIGGLAKQAAGLERQRDLLEEEASGARQLLPMGAIPKTRVLALGRDAAQLEADLGARRAEIARVQEAIGEANLEIARIERTMMSEITDRLRVVQSKLLAIEPKIQAASDVLRRTDIVAPASGAVVGLSVFTEGGVIQAGAKLLDVVPLDNALIVEARLQLNDISEVAIGREADIRLTSLRRGERPPIRGEITVVSADRITDERSGQAYYAVRIRMSAEDVRNAGVALQSGMAVEVMVPTRGRTLVEYLIGPLLDEISGSLRER